MADFNNYFRPPPAEAEAAVEVRTAKPQRTPRAPRFSRLRIQRVGREAVVSGTKLTGPPLCSKFLGELDFLAALAILAVQLKRCVHGK